MLENGGGRKRIHIHAHTHTHIHTHIHTYTHTYTHAHTHAHTRANAYTPIFIRPHSGVKLHMGWLQSVGSMKL